MTWISEIRDHAAKVRPYPATMREIPCSPFGSIPGRSFFPGGSGGLNADAADRARPDIMLIGNDFGTFDEDYVGAAHAGEESLAGTWAGIIDVLSRAGVAPSRVFFTNAIMGARVLPPNRGRSPALKDREFTKRCVLFLRQQIAIVKPLGVVMLGKEQASIVGEALPDLKALVGCSTWKDIDNAGLQFRESVSVSEGPVVRFCALMHPCMRASNMAQRGRHFKEFRNDAAELEMLRRIATKEP